MEHIFSGINTFYFKFHVSDTPHPEVTAVTKWVLRQLNGVAEC